MATTKFTVEITAEELAKAALVKLQDVVAKCTEYEQALAQYADDRAWEYAEDATDANPIRRKWVIGEDGFNLARVVLEKHKPA